LTILVLWCQLYAMLSDRRIYERKCFDSGFQPRFESNDEARRAALEDLEIQYPYAYHFDAGLIASFLSSYAQKQGVTCIKDDVVDVKLSDSGFLVSVQTRNHGPVVADLFVDCTGFRGLLINQVLREPLYSGAMRRPASSMGSRT